MKINSRSLRTAVAVAVAGMAFGAFAQKSTVEHERKNLVIPAGMSAMIGGGAVTYSDGAVRAVTDYGFSWTARIGIGTRSLFGVEAAYIGTSQNINALGLDPEAVLVANGAEAAVRWNIYEGDFQPYALVGVAYKYYSLQNTSYNNSAVGDSDHVFEFPAAVGLAYRNSGLIADLRVSYRPAILTDMLANGSLHNWDFGLRLGYEF